MKQQRKTSRFNLKSSKTKLIAGVTAAALVPTISIAVISNVVTKGIIHDQVSNSTLQVTKEANAILDYKMEGVSSQLELVTNNINFTEFYQNPENVNYGFYLLEGVQKTGSDYASVYFATSKKDMILAPKTELPEGYDPTKRDWYKGAVEQNGKVYFSEPYEDAFTKKQVLTLAQTVKDKNGQLVGVAAIDIFMDKFANTINQIKIGKTGYMTILGPNGKYIFHPDTKRIGSTLPSSDPLAKALSKQKEGFSDYQINGKNTFSAFTSNEQIGWRFVSSLDEAEIVESANRIRDIGWILTAIFGVLTSLFAYFFGRRIANNVLTIKKALETASKGDFTARVTINTKDEFNDLEQSFNQTMEQLSSTLKNVEQTSKTVLETSSQLSLMTRETSASLSEVAVAIDEIAQGAGSQARNVNVSSEQMQDLSQQLDEISATSENMNLVSERSMELSNKGLEQVVFLTEKSSETKTSTNEVTSIVKEVDVRMGEINAIIEAITKITDQTNLLALNASIESARAGEHGRGFAVVANEVRKLAEQSRASAHEIKSIVDSIKTVVSKAVEAMERTNQAVTEQDIAVFQTKDIFNDILSAVHDLAKKAAEVQASIEESKENKDTVSQEMASITAVSEQTAAATEEVSASAEQISATMASFIEHANGLKELSELLDNDIKKFKLQ
ncbi:methyl-accepting chemotaxis protein [Neobacillus citreus]|uniref:Methyl-accepting chemotaxis protein n=1 Tax=Neobacillus citreus TaxID=2833578 RepID=A0A942Y7L7_9BACI|nr:methyl-accepting chemotaxis protein [Neobacillus citreus]MCH6263909.1 methyl-accepting chemotaxis protein [Neobacillus citreus]